MLFEKSLGGGSWEGTSGRCGASRLLAEATLAVYVDIACDTLRALAIAPLIGCGELSKRVRGSMMSKNYRCGLVQSIILQRIRRGEGEERGYGGLPVALQLISKLWR